MAGLNFQTQTIINKNFDNDSNSVLFEAIETLVDGVSVDAVKVKRDFLFVKDNIKVVRKRAGYAEQKCKATVDFDSLSLLEDDEKKAYCRLDIYLGVEGAEPFIYAAPWVQKGIPFWVEFTVTENNAASVAQHVANMIKQNNLFQIDKDLLKVSVEGNKLVLEGATEYQRFRKVEIHKFAADADYSDKVAELGESGVALNARGYNSFGTYSQIIKDLRLPTAENYQWLHIRQSETPIVGEIYDQFIVEYCAPASNEGLGAVGQRLESHTTHVFWVKNDISADFEALFDEVVDVQDEIDARTASPTNAEANTENELGE